MKWYSSLSKLLLEQTSQKDNKFAESRGILADRIVALYKTILRYIIQSICTCYRKPVLQYLRNTVKRDGWAESLAEVTEAEDLVKAAAGAFGIRQANSYLGLLVDMHISTAQDGIMQKLCETDMSAEIKSLQQRKDVLLEDSYRWILDTKDYRDFTEWEKGNTKRLLWIKGEAGKGKTMLLMGIVTSLAAELETYFDQPSLSYFFCQATNNRLNTATAVVRGLIWMLLCQRKSLIRHLDKFKNLGSTLFEAHASFYSLKEILLDMLQDKELDRVYLAVDALDECRKEEPGLGQLLELISEVADNNSHVKWLVTSRNQSHIGSLLDKCDRGARLSLELNADSVAGAVSSYIDHKMLDLAARFEHTYRDCDESVLQEIKQAQEQIAEEIRQNAGGTFLWVALVFRQIRDDTDCGADEVLKLVHGIPQGLDGMYDDMMQKIIQRQDAYSQYSKLILLVMVNAYRPLQLSELATLAKLPKLAAHRNIVRICGLLTIKEDDQTVYFVHQSAKDYLLRSPSSALLSEIFPKGPAVGHHMILSQSLEAMATKLRKNLYNLDRPGLNIADVPARHPDPLASIRYACVYWVDHLAEMKRSRDKEGPYEECVSDGGSAHIFLQESFLCWLEALSLLGNVPDGVLAIRQLENLLTVSPLAYFHREKLPACIADLREFKETPTNSRFRDFVQDAHRFIQYHQTSIENSPLQVYSSALIFSPARSIIRQQFRRDEPEWITRKPKMAENWDACLRTLEGHGSSVYSVTWSHDATRLASAARDGTVKIWDPATGECLLTLKGLFVSGPDHRWINSVAWSHNSTRIASSLGGKTVKILDPATGECLSLLEGHSNRVYSVAWSHDSARLASVSYDTTVKIWDTASSQCLMTLEGHDRWVGTAAALPCEPRRLTPELTDELADSRESTEAKPSYRRTNRWVNSVAWSHDSARLASASDFSNIKIWDSATGQCLREIRTYSFSIDWSHDSTRLATAGMIRIWDPETGRRVLEMVDPWKQSNSVVWSHDSTRLASACKDKMIYIWDSATGQRLSMLKGHARLVNAAAWSHNSTRLASASDDGTIKIWDPAASGCRSTAEGVPMAEDPPAFKGARHWINSVAWSQDATRIASGSEDGKIKIWDGATGQCLLTIENQRGSVESVAWSHDSTRLAAASMSTSYNPVNIWDPTTGKHLFSLEGNRDLASTLEGYEVVDNIQYSYRGPTPPLNVADSRPESPSRPVTSLATLYSVSSDNVWITYRGENLLWLPPEYRPTRFAVSGTSLALGCSSGNVLGLTFFDGKPSL